MPTFKHLTITLLCTLSCAVAAIGESPHRWLDSLDMALLNHDRQIHMHQIRIDSLRARVYPSAFAREIALQDAYKSFSLDSAIMHAHRAISAASTARETTEARMALASLYNTSGVMYKEASDIFNTLDRSTLTDDRMLSGYYTLGVQINRNLGQHSLDPELRKLYHNRKLAYRDSSLSLQPDNNVLLAYRDIDAGNYNHGIELMLRDLEDGRTDRAAAVTYNVLAQAYAEQGNREDAMKYLAQSARCDVESGVREYKSLPALALMLYEDGDYDRAHRYIHQSIRDAHACNAKLRILEMSTILPVIDQALEQSKEESRHRLYLLLVFIVLLCIVLVLIVLTRHRQNVKLRAANAAQQALNDKLTASDRVKQEYVTRFMNLCLEYLAQMESYRRNLLRIAAHRNFEELCDAIKSERYISKEVSDFYVKFDNAFLKLFPTFVDDFKALLEPGYDFRIRRGEGLNTELRIFALMRLGITDSESICKFLRCSASTVYNYRTRLRNIALHRDTFEEDLMAIGSPNQLQ